MLYLVKHIIFRVTIHYCKRYNKTQTYLKRSHGCKETNLNQYYLITKDQIASHTISFKA